VPDDPGSRPVVEAMWVDLMHPGSAGCCLRLISLHVGLAVVDILFV
jgi:hypothetical protein